MIEAKRIDIGRTWITPTAPFRLVQWADDIDPEAKEELFDHSNFARFVAVGGSEHASDGATDGLAQ